ncbi:regulator of G-protein signaling 19 isoform X2 [Pseudophryne corroboree]|uniref:regulator of G-protein signaling 19 isoform X2 n=1 Tax=Pseudophryne corroboree TaxID=495146 RepID=UPI0030816489
MGAARMRSPALAVSLSPGPSRVSRSPGPSLPVPALSLARRMCFRKRPGSAAAQIYTGPDPSESPMSRYDRNQPTRNHRSNPCCFCWCCCCSCFWNEDRNRRRRLSRDTKLEAVSHCEVCTKPSSDEVHSWSHSFEKLMKNPAGRNLFREFLRTEYSEENMLFWLACEELKKDNGKHSVEEKARIIYEDYISILSPKEVSLDSRVREVINRRMQDPSSHTFDDAQLQIYTLMHRDSYPRFLNSGIYKALLQNISRSSSES